MDDAVSAYCAASAARDIDGLMFTLAPEIQVVSPLSARMVFSGRDDVRMLLGAVYSSLSGLRWGEQIGTGAHRVVIGEARTAGLPLDDAMIFELAADGRISRIRPHLRPWLGVSVFALRLGAKLIRHPRILMRAVASGRGSAATLAS